MVLISRMGERSSPRASPRDDRSFFISCNSSIIAFCPALRDSMSFCKISKRSLLNSSIDGWVRPTWGAKSMSAISPPPISNRLCLMMPLSLYGILPLYHQDNNKQNTKCTLPACRRHNFIKVPPCFSLQDRTESMGRHQGILSPVDGLD